MAYILKQLFLWSWLTKEEPGMDTNITESTSQLMMATCKAGHFIIIFIIKILFLIYLLPGRGWKVRAWRTQAGGRARASGSQRGASSTSAGAIRPDSREAWSGGLTHSPPRGPSDPRCGVQHTAEGEKLSPGATSPGQPLSSSQNEWACASLPSMIHSSQLCSDGSCCHIKKPREDSGPICHGTQHLPLKVPNMNLGPSVCFMSGKGIEWGRRRGSWVQMKDRKPREIDITDGQHHSESEWVRKTVNHKLDLSASSFATDSVEFSFVYTYSHVLQRCHYVKTVVFLSCHKSLDLNAISIVYSLEDIVSYY